MEQERLERRLTELEIRLARIEARLQPAPPEPATPPSVSAPPAPPLPPLAQRAEQLKQPSSASAKAVVLAEQSGPGAVPPRLTDIASAKPIEAPLLELNLTPGPTSSASLPASPLVYRGTLKQAPPRPRSSLEQAIGLQWSGWIGAIVLVIGGAMAVKFAYDQGWWQQVPAMIRLILMSMGGVALLAAGEWVYRKINVVAAASLFGAGVAIFFLVSYAGNAYYGLYSTNGAFVLMAVSTLIGAAIAIRGNLVSIAVLALIGGNIAPLVLRTDHPHVPSFLGYLLMLEVVALLLARRGIAGKWWTLRGLSLATTSFWVAGLLFDLPSLRGSAVLLTFLVLFAVFYHAELIFSAGQMRGRLDAYGGFFSTLVTAAFVAAVLGVEDDAGPAVRGTWVLATCAIVFAVGALLRRAKSESALRLLAPGYLLQAGALFVLAVPIMFKGVGVPVGWGAMALVFAIHGAVLKRAIAQGFALVCWLLALIALAMHVTAGTSIGSWIGGNPVVWFHFARVAFYDYTIVGFVLALIGHAVGSLNAWRRVVPDQALQVAKVDESASLLLVTTSLADIVWVVVAMASFEPLQASLALAVLAWLLAAIDRLDRRPAWVVHSIALLLIAIVKWAFVDMLTDFWSAQSAATWATRYAPVFNPLIGMGLLLTASLVVEFWLMRARLADVFSRWVGGGFDQRRSVLGCAGLTISVVTFALSFEIVRVVQLAVLHGGPMVWTPGQLIQLGWTVLWMIASCVFLGLSYAVETPANRGGWVRAAARLPLVIVVKFLLIDTLWFRIIDDPAPAIVGANLQTWTALAILCGLGLAWFVGRWRDERGLPDTRLQFSAAIFGALVVLWCGTLEIDRACENLAINPTSAVNAHLAKQVALSVYWSIFALCAIAAGFKVRSSAIRYLGLTLFGLTLLKVILVDLSQVGRGYRILSFLALGLLLLGTSVLYGRLTPRLLGVTSGDPKNSAA